MQLNSLLVKSSLVGALGGLLFGFDTAVISGTTNSLTHFFSLSPTQLATTVSIALIGTVIGAMSAGIEKVSTWRCSVAGFKLSGECE